MRRLAIALSALILLRADMYPDASNAKQPEARKNLDTGIINVKDYGAKGDGKRRLCQITGTASSPTITVSTPCSWEFGSSDAGKYIAIGLANATTATSPQATTIASVNGASVTLGTNLGRALTGTFTGNTHSSSLIDGISSTVGLVPGQRIQGAGLPWGVSIVSVAANSITVNTAATATASSVPLTSSTWVTWGTDNSAAINAAYLQAGKQVDAGGQQGIVFFPPLANHGGDPQTNCWGVASSINIGPDPGWPYATSTMGVGKWASQVCALAPMASVVNGPDGFVWSQTVIRDISFDGNMLATTTGSFQCAQGHLNNVGFFNPAPGGSAFKIGNSSACNTLQTHDLWADANSAFYQFPAQWPADLVMVDNTDTQHYGIVVTGPSSHASIYLTPGSANTFLMSPHIWGNTAPYGIRVEHLAQIYYVQSDANAYGTTLVSVAGPNTHVHGGHMIGTPSPTNTLVQIEGGIFPVTVTDFYCGNFSPFSNCIKESPPVSSINMIYGNMYASQVPITTEVINQSPVAPASAANFTFMGLNTTFTPGASGVLDIVANLVTSNTLAANGVQYKIVMGYGTVPTNGQNCVTGGGTTIWTQGAPQTTNGGNAGQYIPISLKLNGGGYRGTTYWADLCGKLTAGGTAGIFNVDLKVKEDGLRQ